MASFSFPFFTDSVYYREKEKANWLSDKICVSEYIEPISQHDRDLNPETAMRMESLDKMGFTFITAEGKLMKPGCHAGGAEGNFSGKKDRAGGQLNAVPLPDLLPAWSQASGIQRRREQKSEPARTMDSRKIRFWEPLKNNQKMLDIIPQIWYYIDN